MKIPSRLTCVLCSVMLVLLTLSRPARANSYCAGCGAAIAGAAIGVGVAIGVGIYFIHRGHTSLSGCVQQTDAGLRLIAKDGNSYELVNAPIGVKPLKRFSLRGHKANSSSGHTFRVDHASHDSATCSP